MNLNLIFGGQFRPASGGQFQPALGGQFKSARGGQFHRFLQSPSKKLDNKDKKAPTICSTKVKIR